MAGTAEMQELMHEESLKEMETMNKRAKAVLGVVDMHGLMTEESGIDIQIMYARGEQVTRQ